MLDTVLQYIFQLDGRLLLLIQEYLRFDALTPFMVRFTKLGNMGIIWIVITVLLLIPKKTRKTGFLCAVCLVCSLCITNFFLKNYVARVRPYEVLEGLNCLIGPQKDWSFPSGHASASFAAAVLIYKNRPKRLGIPCMALAIALSWSRLYVGVHYPTDVICGALIGTAIALVVFWIGGEKKYKKKARRKRRRK